MLHRLTSLIFLMLSFSMAQHAIAQANIGFEDGTFENWDFAVGNIQINGEVTTYPSVAVPGSFTILKNDHTDQRDRYGNFSIFSPNGSNYCVKLGNTVYGNTVQQMSYTLTVPPTGSNSILFNYAVVLMSPGHELFQQPRFTVKIFNVTDNKYLDCPAFDFIARSDLPGFKLTDEGVFVKDWASASINLTGLNNKNIRLEFTVNHCPFGQHSGYAYIDIDENIGSPIQGSSYCKDQSAINLVAPPGFASYSWYTADLKTPLGTGQFLTLVPSASLTDLAVKITPYNGLGCSDVLYTTIKGINSNLNFVAKANITGCPGGSVDLTAPEVTAGSNQGLTLSYLTDGFELLTSPYRITKSGLYYIRATNAGGCSNLLPVKVSFELPQLQVIDPAPVDYPLTIDLSKTFTHQPGYTYSYYADEGATQPLTNYTALQISGKYFIKAETTSGCSNVQPVNVNVTPPIPLTITAPNTFTPNNDAVNDHFNITTAGYLSFGSLKVYNRNGTLLFNTTDLEQYWDGNYNGKPVPAGTYYWVFSGTDSFYHKKVERAASITLIR